MVNGQLIDEAVTLVRSRWNASPLVGIILGTGLGGLVEDIQVEQTFEFGELPGFSPTTALGHRGRLVCGQLAGRPVVALDGRLHRYEGHGLGRITLGVDLFHRLGAGGLIVSNASGGVNPALAAGDLLVMESHLNLMFLEARDSACSDAEPGPLPPRAGRIGASPYHLPWVEMALAVAAEQGFRAMAGTYVAMTGPNYETRAEYRMVRSLGGDVVGMSTVPEVIMASRHGMKVLGLSAVTNVADPAVAVGTTAGEVIEIARTLQPAMQAIVAAIVTAEDQPDSSR